MYKDETMPIKPRPREETKPMGSGTTTDPIDADAPVVRHRPKKEKAQ